MGAALKRGHFNDVAPHCACSAVQPRVVLSFEGETHKHARAFKRTENTYFLRFPCVSRNFNNGYDFRVPEDRGVISDTETFLGAAYKESPHSVILPFPCA